MRRLTTWSAVALALPMLCLTACGEREVDAEGEGARRYGYVPVEDAGPQKRLGVAKAAVVKPAPQPKQDRTEKEEARGRRRRTKPKGGKSKYEVVAVAEAGTIKGTVKLDKAVEPWLIPISKDKENCGNHDSHATERLVYDAERLTLANVVVTLEGIDEGKDWPEDMRAKTRTWDIDQRECKYVPHVGVIREKTLLRVDNGDNAEHNIHGYYNSLSTTVFNFFTSAGSQDTATNDTMLKKAGIYIMKCDIHPWMNAYIHTVKTPYYALTGKDGAFELTEVPPGTYTLRVWHESLTEEKQMVSGEISGYTYGDDWVAEAEVVVKAGETVVKEFVRPTN